MGRELAREAGPILTAGNTFPAPDRGRARPGAPAALTRGFSLYLDAIRFLAALVVVASHAGHERFSKGFFFDLRQLDIASDAVIVFFVLSGFVIAYTTLVNRRGAQAFAEARLARLYSVVIPALAVTFVLDTAGTLIYPETYQAWWYDGTGRVGQYLRAFFFSTQIMPENTRPGTNTPFWSVSYEAWYYLAFGIAVFARGRMRALLLAAVAIAAGPRILLLAPAWLLGVGLFLHLQNGGAKRISRLMALIFTAAPLCLYILMMAAQIPARLTFIMVHLGVPIDALGFSDRFIWENLLGLLIAIHFLGIYCLSGEARWIPARIGNAVRWCAGATFSIYLFHFPILSFLHALPGYDPGNTLHVQMLFAATLLACFALAEISERRLDVWKRMVNAILQRFTARPAAEVPGT
ncbi:acyltransferase family protein [Hyphomonas sp.]|uniref:acyltransferase family protein n=1 Tax=Hyphomonas sp. TaxID=87 RepID=UPI00352950A7